MMPTMKKLRFSPKMLTRKLVVAALLWLPVAQAQAQGAKGPDSEAACAAQAKAWFAKAHPQAQKQVKDLTRTASYKARYSVARKQCLVLEDVSVSRAGSKGAARVGRQLFTFSGERRSVLGRLVGPDPLTCEMQGKACSNMEEWDKLAAALMKQ